MVVSITQLCYMSSAEELGSVFNNGVDVARPVKWLFTACLLTAAACHLGNVSIRLRQES